MKAKLIIKAAGLPDFEHVINANASSTDIVKMSLAQLKNIRESRKGRPDTTGLEEDIFALEWILANNKCEEYLEWRHVKNPLHPKKIFEFYKEKTGLDHGSWPQNLN